jgi:hypothetical protein
VKDIDRVAQAAREAYREVETRDVTPYTWTPWAECTEYHREAWRSVVRLVAEHPTNEEAP